LNFYFPKFLEVQKTLRQSSGANLERFLAGRRVVKNLFADIAVLQMFFCILMRIQRNPTRALPLYHAMQALSLISRTI